MAGAGATERRVVAALRVSLRGQRIRRLFTSFDARADFILYPCRSPYGGRLNAQGSDDMAARARPLRVQHGVQPSWSEYRYQRARRAQMGGAA